ncbi:MAG: hypothetical protein DA408_09395 [Bacteroidetes bacterium]|nr:MAG: hypothetical protein C7N36_20535 [Bacteroidota bacterium]PTM12705.1 MAG: hypothetical protein DA408_09395 [Bacteroidota bacterium]
MSAKETLSLFLLLSVVCVLFVYGFNREVKTFGITGNIMFENENPAGTVVIYSTSDEQPSLTDASQIKETLLQDGFFYRPINEFGGRDINIWIHRKGYPLIHSTKVLAPHQGNVDFGEIVIPAAFRSSDSAILQVKYFNGFKTKCLDGPAEAINMCEVACIKNFSKNYPSPQDCPQQPAEVYCANFYLQSASSASSVAQSISLFFGR